MCGHSSVNRLKECTKYFNIGHLCDKSVDVIVHAIHEVQGPLSERDTETLKEAIKYFKTLSGSQTSVEVLAAIVSGTAVEMEKLVQAREWVGKIFRKALGNLDELLYH